jgi:hypothetical protein
MNNITQFERVSINKIKNNPNNPRLIKDDKFNKLVKSIQDFPEMLEIRPIVVNDQMVVLGGNMRLKACIDAGLKEVPIIKASSLTESQQKQFIIKDNVGFGEWDWDTLANEWDTEDLNEWGLDVYIPTGDINLDSFFEENNEQKEQKNKITLEYTEEDFTLVTEAFSKHSGSKEQIVFKLLGL